MTAKLTVWSRYAVGAILTGVMGGCSSGPQTGQQAQRVIPVKAITVTQDAQTTYRDYVGVIEEESAAWLSFQVQGYVERIDAQEGRRVAQGEPLASLDTRNLKSTHEAALASLKQAEDALQRLQLLYDNQSLPEIQYVEAQTKLRQAQSMEEISRKNLEDSQLKAPFNGVIGQRRVEVGENVMPGQPVLSLLKIATVKACIPVPEQEIASLSSGCPAVVTVAALGDKRFEGRVAEKGIEADPVAHTYEVRIPLSNLSGELMPGMVCRVQLQPNETATVTTLPNKAVQIAETGERFVWIVQEGQAVRQPVQTGALTDDGLIITQGLKEGDQVICEGYQKVSEGTKVDVLP